MGAGINCQSEEKTPEEDTFKGIFQSRDSFGKQKILFKSRFYDENRPDSFLLVRPNDPNSLAFTSYLRKLIERGPLLDHPSLYIPSLLVSVQMDVGCTQNDSPRDYKLLYENFPIKMERQLAYRRINRLRFTEGQLWYILYLLADAMRQFEATGFSSGDLTVNSIVLNREGGIKVKNSLTTWSEEKDSQIKNYYSSEQMAILQNHFEREVDFTEQFCAMFKINPHVCQTYSIGILMIELANLSEAQAFYNMQKLVINQAGIDQELKMMREIGYSKLFVNFISAMMGGYNDRPLPSQIHAFLRNYEKNIYSFTPFKVNSSSSQSQSLRRFDSPRQSTNSSIDYRRIYSS